LEANQRNTLHPTSASSTGVVLDHPHPTKKKRCGGGQEPEAEVGWRVFGRGERVIDGEKKRVSGDLGSVE
jgi:hypothetical protein